VRRCGAEVTVVRGCGAEMTTAGYSGPLYQSEGRSRERVGRADLSTPRLSCPPLETAYGTQLPYISNSQSVSAPQKRAHSSRLKSV